MTFKITVVLCLCGHLDSESVEELRAQVLSHDSHALDLAEVTLVDVAVVRFLRACEAEGMEMLNCSRYIREWIDRERL
jgi:anti-anti-sigma regulatory factor